MHTYLGSVVLLHQGAKVTVALVVCGEGYEERAGQYVKSHPLRDGTYEIQEVEAEVTEHPPTWGVVGERS